MTNVNIALIELAPMGGIGGSSWKLGFVDSAAKAAQNDTLTITNADSIDGVGAVLLHDDTTGVIDAGTVSRNVVTLTTVATGNVSGVIVYKS